MSETGASEATGNSVWAAGRYESVAERIASIAGEVVNAVDARRALAKATVVDLACGTGSAALTAAGLGAAVTGVDLTAELIAIGKRKADALGHSVTWVTADAAHTGLPDSEFDAVVSNMGIIFVEPNSQVTEIARLLKSDGVLGFSSWTRSDDWPNPFFDPIVSVLGAPPPRPFSPDQWGERDTIAARLADDFDGVHFDDGVCTWRFASLAAAVDFVTKESPMHVDIFGRIDGTQREELAAAFSDALSAHIDDTGAVSFGAPYVVVTARRR